MTSPTEQDPGARLAILTGFWLLAIALPLGITLEALHALKVPVYLHSALRREMWTLAHAHGNLLGVLCLAYGAIAERWLAPARMRRRVARWLVAGAIAMTLGFFLGGILNFEGDPSLGILFVPLGGACLLIALGSAVFAVGRPHP